MHFEKVTEFGYGYIQDIKEDSQGNIWIAAMGNGVYRYNIRSQEAEQYLADGKHILLQFIIDARTLFGSLSHFVCAT